MVDQRTHVCCLIQGVADSELLDFPDEPPVEVVGDVLLNQYPLYGDARLAGLVIAAVGDTARGIVEVCIRVNDDARVSPELERDGLFGRGGREIPADRRRPRERDLGKAVVG